MRKDISQVLENANVDMRREYSMLYDLFFECPSGYDPLLSDYPYDYLSIADYIDSHFFDVPFRDTCTNLKDFERKCGWNFVSRPRNFNLFYLVDLCEFVYNLVYCMDTSDFNFQLWLKKKNVLDQIKKIIEKIGYISITKNKLTIFVERDAAAVSVAEILPPPVSYRVISYNHRSMKGNIEIKKETLLKFSDLLEPKRDELKRMDEKFTSDLFYMFNNFNLRHNNIDPCLKGKYKKVIAEMPNDKLESWYDEIYQMCLLAFLRIEHIQREKFIDTIKRLIEEN